MDDDLDLVPMMRETNAVGADSDNRHRVVPRPVETMRKRRKMEVYSPPLRWRTETEQQIYSSKLFHALRRVNSSYPASSLPRARAVRKAADRALAFTAGGRTRWSRAILLSGHRALRPKAIRRRPKNPFLPPSTSTSKTQITTASRDAPSLDRKGKVLGRLVPGCRKLPFPALLDETSDYIAALQMQVRTMTALANVLTSSAVATTLT